MRFPTSSSHHYWTLGLCLTWSDPWNGTGNPKHPHHALYTMTTVDLWMAATSTHPHLFHALALMARIKVDPGMILMVTNPFASFPLQSSHWHIVFVIETVACISVKRRQYQIITLVSSKSYRSKCKQLFVLIFFSFQVCCPCCCSRSGHLSESQWRDIFP